MKDFTVVTLGGGEGGIATRAAEVAFVEGVRACFRNRTADGWPRDEIKENLQDWIAEIVDAIKE